MKQLLLSLSLFSLLLLGACNQDTEGPGGETPDEYEPFSFTLIDPDTEDCIIGYDKPIHPDSIQLFDEEFNELPLNILDFAYSGNWSISDVNVNYVESYYDWDRNSNYETDFYILIDGVDYDTIHVTLDPERPLNEEVWFNGSRNISKPQGQSDYASVYFRKKITLN